MHTTPVSLLERLRRPDEQQAWSRFVDLYTPLIYHWGRKVGLQAEDAADLVQEVFAVLVQKMPHFVYDGQKSFRAWLHTVTLNKWRDRHKQRVEAPLDPSGPTMTTQSAPGGDSFEEAEYRSHLIGRALELMQADFQTSTWKACWEQVVVGRPAAEVAAELNMTLGAVYAAKFRVLARLREELKGLLD